MKLIPSGVRANPARSDESGTIIVVLLILISVFSVITLGASHSLARLRSEVLALEHRQAARASGATNQTSKPVSIPSPSPEVPPAKTPVP